MPVRNALIKTKMLQSNMPFLLWISGPGPSLMLTHKAPKDKARPVSKSPRKENTIAGIIISSVIRIPSERYWLNKKYRICCDLSMYYYNAKKDKITC
jgi:hypothetical protein